MKYRKKISSLILIMDIVVMVLSLGLSRVIRSQLPFFLYEIEKLFVIAPYIIISRILVNIFFEHYSLSFRNMTMNDILNLFKHHIIPTMLLIVLRFVSPISYFRFPLSMILVEYFLTVSGMVLIRIVTVTLYLERSKKNKKPAVKYANSIIVGRKSDFPPGFDMQVFEKKYLNSVKYIISPEKIEWNTDYEGVRIIGGMKELQKIADSEEHINNVIILHPGIATDFPDMFQVCAHNHINMFLLGNDGIHSLLITDILGADRHLYNPVPEQVLKKLCSRTIAVVGIESSVVEEIKKELNEIKEINWMYFNYTDIDKAIVNSNIDTIIDFTPVMFQELVHTNIYDYCTKIKPMQCVNKQYLIVLQNERNLDVEKCISIKNNLLLSEGIITNMLHYREDAVLKYTHFITCRQFVSTCLKSVCLLEKDKTKILVSRNPDSYTVEEVIHMLKTLSTHYRWKRIEPPLSLYKNTYEKYMVAETFTDIYVIRTSRLS
jgi:hypothetical protein